MTNMLGDKIKKARQAEGLTQSQLASKIGCSRNTISRWEQDKFKPSHEELLKLNTLIQIDIEAEDESENEKDISDVVHELRQISMNIEDLRLDANQKEKRYRILIISLIIVFISFLIAQWLWLNWKDPSEPDDEPIAVYYYSTNGELLK